VLLPRGVRSRSRTSSRVPGGTDELDDRAPEQCHRHGVPVVLVQVLHLDHCRHAVSVSAAPPAAHRADSHIRRTDRLNPRTNDRLTRIRRSADGAKKKAPKPHPQPLGHGRQARQHAHRSTSSGRCGSRHLTVRRPIITADIARQPRASDHHVARSMFLNVSEPSADSAQAVVASVGLMTAHRSSGSAS
jgi:hypothetical protein